MFIFFVCNRRIGTHNPSVVGSSPTAATNQINNFRRWCCRTLRTSQLPVPPNSAGRLTADDQTPLAAMENTVSISPMKAKMAEAVAPKTILIGLGRASSAGLLQTSMRKRWLHAEHPEELNVMPLRIRSRLNIARNIKCNPVSRKAPVGRARNRFAADDFATTILPGLCCNWIG